MKGGQCLELSTKATVFKIESLLNGGGGGGIWGWRRACYYQTAMNSTDSHIMKP